MAHFNQRTLFYEMQHMDLLEAFCFSATWLTSSNLLGGVLEVGESVTGSTAGAFSALGSGVGSTWESSWAGGGEVLEVWTRT